MENGSEERHEGNGSIVGFGIASILVVIILLALFIWQPWNMLSPVLRGTKTTITQPG